MAPLRAAPHSPQALLRAAPFLAILALAGDLQYVQASCGLAHTVLLQSDGQAVACGDNSSGACNIPRLEENLTYLQVSAGGVTNGLGHTVLLQSDGCAVACGDNIQGQCDLPILEPGVKYVQVSAGDEHTVLLQSDGNAVACGADRGVWNSKNPK